MVRDGHVYRHDSRRQAIANRQSVVEWVPRDACTKASTYDALGLNPLRAQPRHSRLVEAAEAELQVAVERHVARYKIMHPASQAELSRRQYQAARCRVDTRPFVVDLARTCLLYTSPSPRDRTRSRMPSSA